MVLKILVWGFKKKKEIKIKSWCFDYKDGWKASPKMANSATALLNHLKVKQIEQGHKCNRDSSPPLGTKSVSLALRGLIINLWATRTPYFLRLYAAKG